MTSRKPSRGGDLRLISAGWDRDGVPEAPLRPGLGLTQAGLSEAEGGQNSSATMKAWAHEQQLQNFWMCKSTFLHLCAKLTKIKLYLQWRRKNNCTVEDLQHQILIDQSVVSRLNQGGMDFFKLHDVCLARKRERN
ncbi:unnamed protein product [Caretta caretta]